MSESLQLRIVEELREIKGLLLRLLPSGADSAEKKTTIGLDKNPVLVGQRWVVRLKALAVDSTVVRDVSYLDNDTVVLTNTKNGMAVRFQRSDIEFLELLST